MASLDIQRSDVAEQNYLRCVTIVNISITKYIITTSPTRYYKLVRSINKDVSRAIVIEILFHLPFYVKFSYDITIIQYYGHRLGNPLQPEIYTRTISQKSL